MYKGIDQSIGPKGGWWVRIPCPPSHTSCQNNREPVQTKASTEIPLIPVMSMPEDPTRGTTPGAYTP
jgi:hypothetical protein